MRFCHIAVSAFLAAFSVAALAQSSCEIVPQEAVEKAFPDYLPWETEQGGVGACMFEGRVKLEGGAWTTAMLKVNHQFKNSPAEVSTLIRRLAIELAPNNGIRKTTALGPDGFYYWPKSMPSAGIWWVGQSGKALSMGSLMIVQHEELTDAELAGVETIAKMALASSQRKGMAEKSASCTYFDRALVGRLFESQTVKIEQHGEASCLASTKDKRLVFSRIDSESDEQAAAVVGPLSNAESCKVEPAPELGNTGRISYQCSGNNRSATALFASANRTVTLTFIAQQALSADQRKALISVGAYARKQVEGQ